MSTDIASAVKISLIVATSCTVLGLLPATFFGWILARKNFRGKALLTSLLFFPLVSPPVVSGLLLLKITGRHGPFSTLGIQIPFTVMGATLAALVVGLPLFIMATRAAFSNLDRNLENYSLSAGHTPWQTFLKVTLPLSFPGILAGAIMTFARSLGEFGATIVLAGNIEGETRTIPMAIYTLLDSPNGESQASTLLWISLALSFAALVGYEAMDRWYWKRLEWHR
jgi:molybdate transport system permease protein